MLRVLFVSDTHLGFDAPEDPRVHRRRRGPDFLANFNRALDVAIETRVDLVVHGGDLFHRSAPPPRVVDAATSALCRVADAGIPVALVCGNHERSKMPSSLFFRHERIHLFDSAKRVSVALGGMNVNISGFPFVRDVRERFSDVVGAIPHDPTADVNLLIFHHAVEGAVVGPSDFTFRHGDDVIARAALPKGFDAILSGHIHRRQLLKLGDATPVIYPGSVERTSFAERDEPKGFLTLDFDPDHGRGAPRRATFHPLPARAMHTVDVPTSGRARMRKTLGDALARLPLDAIVRVRPDASVDGLTEMARALAPSTMTVEVARPAAHRGGAFMAADNHDAREREKPTRVDAAAIIAASSLWQ